MDDSKIDLFLSTKNELFPNEQMPIIREQLQQIDNSRWNSIAVLQFKNPTTALILSLFFGFLGVDRFYIGDTGTGIFKLLTLGGFGLWAIIDWFLIMRATRKNNLRRLNNTIF